MRGKFALSGNNVESSCHEFNMNEYLLHASLTAILLILQISSPFVFKLLLHRPFFRYEVNLQSHVEQSSFQNVTNRQNLHQNITGSITDLGPNQLQLFAIDPVMLG